ncbi:hypothetical protein Bca52824_023812 [Brassica carinata]|uniref:F-box domain-containing protein n=1 Tax=Brassica carinata TaxID=52824 RepID=A0A8X7VJV4_BRACI|nr:hypothetical protein Bca52824_023812 [Brassica carinata]
MASPSPYSTTVASKSTKTQREDALDTSISFSDLPSRLLEVIMYRLVLKDNICASAVCKSWCEAAASVRVMEKHPWLMCFDKHCSSFELRDPVRSKLYTMHLPELAESAVCFIKDGWLLMYTSSSKDMFFFNPFTRELVSLPKFSVPFQAIAFSSPPTSDNCVLIALDFVTRVQERRILISTCQPGATEWITEAFPTLLPFYRHSKLVYLNERFYCFTIGGGYLYSFHPSSRTWVCHQDAYVYHQLQGEWDKRETFLAERKGEVFLMFACSKEKPLVFKLVSLEWEEVTSTELDGFTAFFSSYNSELRTNLPSMRNNLCFPWFGEKRKLCVSYSFDNSSYNPPQESLNWLQLIPRQKCLWINPPSTVLDYLHED